MPLPTGEFATLDASVLTQADFYFPPLTLLVAGKGHLMISFVRLSRAPENNSTCVFKIDQDSTDKYIFPVESLRPRRSDN